MRRLGMILFVVSVCFGCVAAMADDPPGYAAWKAGLHHGSAVLSIVGPECNSTVVCVQADDVTGDFNIGTSDGRSLLYYYPSAPWSSNINVRVDGMVYRLDTDTGSPTCDGAATLISVVDANGQITETFSLLGNLSVVVTHTPVTLGTGVGPPLRSRR